ncbi:MAG: hypothetical protein U9Q61_06940 [Thermodesulfobacteriota bacterium]|nr:hypothetical protein [Thermodesulfobacteriota bacterium]
MLNTSLTEKTIQFQPSGRKNSLSLLGFTLLVLLLIGFLFGCADHSARNQELLAENYHSLSNDNLILYYYKLEDQIDVVERRKSKPSFSLGLGLGSFGHSSGGSAGVGVSTGGSSRDVATNLRDRRNEVKLELQHRGIIP